MCDIVLWVEGKNPHKPSIHPLSILSREVAKKRVVTMVRDSYEYMMITVQVAQWLML